MKSFAWRFFSFLLMILTVVGLVGCGNQAVSNPSPVVLPGLTYTAINPTSIFTPKPDNTFMEATKTPPSEEDDLSAQFTDKGYRLVSSGSLIGPEGFTYSASLFINPDLSPLYGGSDSSQDTMVIAFYRWNGDEKKFLGAQGFPAIGDSYAAGANIVNWDQPIPQKPMVEFLVQADEDTRQMLKQEGYFSDVNQNGSPEFAFVTEYCILSCNDPVGGIQLFEIQNPSTIKNITQDLPGLTFFERHSKDPFTFYVEDRDYYDFYAGITTHWIYTWNGSDFIDVSPQYAEEYLAEANSIISDLESWYGKPFDAEIKLEIDSLEILKLYEKAGMSEKGLQVFLDVTDISHWPGTSSLSQCWLQISRAMAQEDVKKNKEFDLPPSSSLLGENTSLVKKYTEPLQRAGYDTSVCVSIAP